MNIVVCVKQVPAISEVSIDPETKRLRREGVRAVMNPFDLYAVEEALQLRERLGGEVTVLSMGPKQAEHSLREALAMGADRALLLSGRAFAGSDTWATSYALACAIRGVDRVDLVLCGKQAVDGDTAQVGPGIAAHLDWPQLTNVVQLAAVTQTAVTAVRLREAGRDTVELRLPALLTVVKDLNRPRVPTLRGVLAARRAQIAVLGPEAIAADPAKLGLDGSPTRVVGTAPPPPRAARTQVIDGTAEDCARALVRALRQHSVM